MLRYNITIKSELKYQYELNNFFSKCMQIRCTEVQIPTWDTVRNICFIFFRFEVKDGERLCIIC